MVDAVHRRAMDTDCQLPDCMPSTSMVTSYWILSTDMARTLQYFLRFVTTSGFATRPVWIYRTSRSDADPTMHNRSAQCSTGDKYGDWPSYAAFRGTST